MTRQNGALSVENLKVHFGGKKSLLSGKASVVHAVDGVSFHVPSGKTLGIVGESGSGKSTTALAIMRLVKMTSGTVTLGNSVISDLTGNDLRHARRRFQIIFQDPYSSLNPRERAGDIVKEPLNLMEIGTKGERSDRVSELFEQVGLRPEQQNLFPHQFSGGQRQRLGFARALSTTPELIVCDEPVSALDVAIQAQILNLMTDLQQQLGLTYLFISHDLGVVQHVCDEIAVMYLGQIVEKADRVSLFSRPQHPYTKALLAAVPTVRGTFVDGKRRDRAVVQRLKGDPPSPINPPDGCRFAGRCPQAESICKQQAPEFRIPDQTNQSHAVACHFA